MILADEVSGAGGSPSCCDSPGASLKRPCGDLLASIKTDHRRAIYQTKVSATLWYWLGRVEMQAVVGVTSWCMGVSHPIPRSNGRWDLEQACCVGLSRCYDRTEAMSPRRPQGLHLQPRSRCAAGRGRYLANRRGWRPGTLTPSPSPGARRAGGDGRVGELSLFPHSLPQPAGARERGRGEESAPGVAAGHARRVPDRLSS